MDDSFNTCFQRFAAFMAPLTSGRVTISVAAIYSAKVCCLSITFTVLSILLDLELYSTLSDFISVHKKTHQFVVRLV